eukprot:gnl/Chilomastix_cuspidata/1655.p1 GENE.gnl/Chilomastix_cuspidata/1655~~gnl/Chilomastix_cuspidata/1655.p1  ORF type:complete len:364 (+),score=110.14 gnl/Chilomastix_cuspidata/1655:96-1094(+)
MSDAPDTEVTGRELVFIPAFLSLVVLATLCIHCGTMLSLKIPSEVQKGVVSMMGKKESQRMPVVASALLLGLFLAFKYLPKNLFNLILQLYFNGSAIITFSQILQHPVERSLPRLAARVPLPRIVRAEVHASQILGGVISAPLLALYALTRHWLLANAIALALSVGSIYIMRLERFRHGIFLLGALLVYDVFWVFGTPVMVTVAKNIDLPVKLVVPRSLSQFAQRELTRPMMLGLGDIVVPGIFIVTAARASADIVGKDGKALRMYGRCMFLYVLALLVTGGVLFVTKHGQPALLYIVPALFVGSLGYTVAKGRFSAVWSWSDPLCSDSATD